jgi:CheY-like chemotaxis protein
MTTPSEILVVDDDVASLASLLSLLRNLGYRTTDAANAEAGDAMLDAFPFDVLIADIHLDGERGLKLIRRAREVQPAIAVIAITAFPDSTAEQEVISLGAIVLRKPIDVRSLREILAEHVTSGRRQRRWNRKHVAGGFGASVAGAAAKIVDVSYGGFRLEMSSPPDLSQTPTINMNLVPFGFAVNADLVWVSRNEPTGSWNCGAVLSTLDPTIERAWRVVVDALPESSSR